MHHGSPFIGLIVIVFVVFTLLVSTLVARRKGYKLGMHTIVRCQRGHLFTTIWLPGGSFKAIRLGFARFQRCSVGNHWSLVIPVKETTLTDDERRFAADGIALDTLLPAG